MKSLVILPVALALAMVGTAVPADIDALSSPAQAGVQSSGGAGSRPSPGNPRFSPQRFSVIVKGSGHDVILIPGLTASRAVWDGTVAAVPGYRYHLIQVAGFAGEPVRGNASGNV